MDGMEETWSRGLASTFPSAALRSGAMSVPKGNPEAPIAGEAEEDPPFFDAAGLETWWRRHRSRRADRNR